jgi:hypothetical protein
MGQKNPKNFVEQIINLKSKRKMIIKLFENNEITEEEKNKQLKLIDDDIKFLRTRLRNKNGIF